MKFLFLALLIMLATGGAAHWALQNPGYAVLAWGHWSVQLSMVYFLTAFVLFFFLFYVSVRVLVRIWRTPGDITDHLHNRHAERARRGLTRGLIELSEGRWRESEKLLLRSAGNSQTPLLNFLAAARSAQMQQAYDRRDEYLRRAFESTPNAQMAVELTQAELQLAHGQTEQALATLNHLREIAPDHTYVTKLLGRLYLQLGDWEALANLLPKLRRATSLDSESISLLESKALGGLFSRQTETADLKALTAFWEALPRKSRQRPELLCIYADQLIRLGENELAERLITRNLNHQWDDVLALRYGTLKLDKVEQQLRQGEIWLQSHPHSSALLLSLARICRHNKLWGKSRSYYEASIGENPNSEAYLELGELLVDLKEDSAARDCFQRGLKLAISHSSGANPPFSVAERKQPIHYQISERMPRDSNDIYIAKP